MLKFWSCCLLDTSDACSPTSLLLFRELPSSSTLLGLSGKPKSPTCDAAALDTLKQKHQKMDELEQERQEAKDEEMDILLAKLVLQSPGLLPDHDPDDIADQLEAIQQTKLAGLIRGRLGLD
mgnify:CR=1 FL=1